MSIGKRLASRSVIMFGLRVGGAGFIFLVQAAIARAWGAEALGDYLLAIAAANLLAVVMPLGFQTVGTYFAAEYGAKGDGRNLRRFLTRSFAHVGIVGTAITALGWPVTYFMGETGEHLLALWVPTALIAMGTAFTFVNTTALVGLKRPLMGYLPDMVLRPALVITSFAIIALTAGRADLNAMLWLFALSLLALELGHFFLLYRAVRQVPVSDEYAPAPSRRWWRFAAPWVLITLAADYFFDINLLMLAELLPRAELAIFGVSTRIFALVSFGVVAVYAMTLPEMFEAESKKDAEALSRRLSEANIVAILLSGALFVGVALFGRYLLLLFGEEFVAGAWPMSILCLALVVRAAFGPASMVLSMRDKPFDSLPAVGLGLVALVAGNALLVPPYGLSGAAISAFIAITLWSAALWATAWRRTGVDVSIFARFRALPA
ncbi:lipopolysaccharide biosynthesis protein [Pelagibacterium xiamenense]|uniref:lipopolysaccharide biosynthesis protein n=1 Tax=Pelagibacterium xiamenense TaxID=2901140 RepID=UPI001E29F443|nr:polysaccharide biosynthesis C-terminal domain-containing protein [Pelagibacterium xiamenense]MCD7060062.1 polysaccharide biosynthesis C-terminal domain-containing protein [Pelagibacterium xiamenense]